MRTSKQRDLIFHLVTNSHSHPTADDVYREARKALPNISLGTVYRNLRQLASDGKIREVQFGSSPARFDGMLAMHEHFICLTCGGVQDIEASLSTPALPGKKVTSYKLDYYGQCELCAFNDA